MCSPGSLGPASSLLGSWNVQLLWANEPPTPSLHSNTRVHTHMQARTHACTHILRHVPRLVKSMASIGSDDFASLFVCVSPDCDTGVKRPIGGGQQVIIQPGTRESKWLETVLVL